MAKVLLLICFGCISHICFAQQKEPDALLNELKKHPQEDTVRLKLLDTISFMYAKINPEEGLIKSDEGISLAQKLKMETALGKCIQNKGINYTYKGQYDSALTMLITALKIFEKKHYQHGILSVLNNIGVIQFYTSDYANALNTYTKNLRIAEQIKDTTSIISAANNVGLTWRAMSNYSAALKFYLQAINLAEKANNKNLLANTYGELGLCYRELKEPEKALQCYNTSLQLCIQTGDKRSESTMLAALGLASADQKDYKQALSYYQQAIKVGNEADNIQTVTATLGNMGDVYKWMLDYANAINYYQKALVLAQQLGDKNSSAYMYGEIGDIYAQAPPGFLNQHPITSEEQHRKAIFNLEESLALAKEIGSLDRQARALDYLSILYEKQQNFQKALAVRKEAVTMEDSIYNDNTKTNITRLEMQYAFNKIQDSIKAHTDKQQALARAETQRQKVISNSLMAGTGIIAIAGFAGFIFYKKNRDIKTQRNEANLKAQVVDTEMKALRAQMNPHFIFNSLNSISDYITKNDTQSADKYLTKFAKVMRLILENSEQKEVCLKDDLKALELYMQLESLRLKNKFTYEINISEEIDQENTLIPPLILQPFVENSIWHGIAKKESNGHIIIYIKREGNMLNCMVEDNGAGIQPATLINTEKKPMGIRITKDRIDLLNKQKNANATVQVYAKEQGVRAEIHLPLQLSF